MAFLDEIKTALRISTADSGITAQLTRMLAEAKLDLCRTADIRPELVNVDEPDALIKGAIICYIGYIWTTDPGEKDHLKDCYTDYKAKLAMSGDYTTAGGG